MPDDVLLLSAQTVAELLPPPVELIDQLETMFRHKAAGHTELPPKLGVHPKDESFIHAMPACIPPMSIAGMKWVAAYPGNPKLNLPQVCGVIVLNHVDSGLPFAILDGTAITTARTAAASALAARYLARDDSRSLGILGCGVQGRSHLAAFAAEFDLHEVYAYDLRLETSGAFAEEMRAAHAIRVEPVRTPVEAVVNCDLVVTAGPITNPPHATIQEDWLPLGAFAASIDYGSYWHPNALAQMDLLFTDDVEQYRSHQDHGYLRGLPAVDHELAELVAGSHPGRTDERQRTCACNLGIALEDIAVAKAVVDLAEAQGAGTRFPIQS